MSATLTTFLFEAINFLILAGVLGWLLFNPVRNALEQRRAEQTRQGEEAAARLAEAEKLGDDIRRRHAALEQELDRIRNDTRQAAEKQAEEIRAAARAAADREREILTHRLSSLEHQQLKRLANGVAATVQSVIERLLEQIDGPDLQKGLVLAACRQLGELEGTSLDPVSVESAVPLAPDLKAAIDAALGDAAKGAQYRTNSQLGAGVRIRTNGGIVDASAVGIAAYAERLLADELLPRDNSSAPPKAEPNSGQPNSAVHAESSASSEEPSSVPDGGAANG